MENKQRICNSLLATLILTREYEDLVRLEYEKEGYDETVIAYYGNGGTRVINVSMDSGSAMIKDILENL